MGKDTETKETGKATSQIWPYLRGNFSDMQEAAIIKKFRAIGTAEGISFLLLLGIAMPLKYMMGIPEAVKYTGWVHGILFVWYCYMVIEAGQALKWKFGRIFLAFLAALLPFGPFLFDRWFLRKGKSVLQD